MQIELTRAFVEYQSQTRLLELAVEIADSKSLSKVKKERTLATKIRLYLKALQYYAYYDKATIDKLVYVLADLSDANAIPYAPVVTSVSAPAILVGIPGDQGIQGEEGSEGGGVPFTTEDITIDTVVDSFPVTDSRGVEYTLNIFDDTAGAMRIMRIQGGWNAAGSSYDDDDGFGKEIVGDTSGISMSIDVNASTVRLIATVTSGTWTVQGTRKYVPNNGSGITTATSLTDGKVWVGNSSNVPTAVTISGDVTITNAGVAAIATGVIVNADINASAAIALSKLATLTASRAVVTTSGGVLTTSTATATEVGYLSGVTSSIQTQLDSKLSAATGAISTVVSSDLTASRAVISNVSGKIAVSAVTSTELGYVSGVTSAIQTQINTKQATITGAATTVTSSNLTADRVLVSNGSGKIAVSTTTATDIENIAGATGTTYTPTLTIVSNLDSTTTGVCQYIRVGDTVTVSGEVSVNPSVAGGLTVFRISLPVASNFASSGQCIGTAVSSTITNNEFGVVIADATNNEAQLSFVCDFATANHGMAFHFTYTIV